MTYQLSDELKERIIHECKYHSDTERVDGELSSNDVDLIISEGKEGFYQIMDGLYENNLYFIFEWESQVIDEIYDDIKHDLPTELEKGEVLELIREVAIDHLHIGFTIAHWLQDGVNSRYVCPIEDQGICIYSFEDDAEEISEFLSSVFKANPREVEKGIYKSPELCPNYWTDMPELNGEELASINELSEMMLNWFMGYHFGLYAMFNDLQLILDCEEREETAGIMIKKGTNVMPHDYLNGCSGIGVTLIKDMYIENPDFSSDGKYGIQDCCGLVNSAWEGSFEIAIPPATCEHPPDKLYSWFARDDSMKDGDVLIVACKLCGEVLSGQFVESEQ